jgi:hypothetical protein
MIHPCACGHEKGDHQMRIGQRGNYTPCCIANCQCSGFRKATQTDRANLLRGAVCQILSATGRYSHDIPRLCKEALERDNAMFYDQTPLDSEGP